jgi:ribosomal protein S18 acetylase RimI-like enzyme
MEIIHTSDLFDLSGWLILAGEAEPLFGKMLESADFFEGLRQSIMQETAFCVRDEANRDNCGLCGGIIISKETNSIEWFFVSEKHRGRGIGKGLLAEAMKHLNHSLPIHVITFDGSAQEGSAARKLYHSAGFVDSSSEGKNPAGFPVVKMVRPALRVFC